MTDFFGTIILSNGDQAWTFSKDSVMEDEEKCVEFLQFARSLENEE